MITSHLLDKLVCRRSKRKHHRRLVLFVAAATVVLIGVGLFFDHHKVVEYGTLWLFEQFIGGAKSTAFGGSSE